MRDYKKTVIHRGYINQEFFDLLFLKNKAFLELFGTNNRYLRECIGISLVTQAKDMLERYSFYTKAESIRLLEVNERYKFSLNWLQAISYYWGIDLLVMLKDDLRAMGYKPVGVVR